MSKQINTNLVKINNQLTSEYGGEVCKKISPESDGLVTWLCVYRNPISYANFTIKKFSVPVDIDHDEYDISDHIMINLFEMDLETLDQVEQNIRKIYGEELSTFQSPFAAGCPF